MSHCIRYTPMKNPYNPLYNLSYDSVLGLIKIDGLNIQFVPDSYMSKEMVLIAVNQNGLSIAYIPDNLKTPDICRAAVRNHKLAIAYVQDIHIPICT